MPINAKTKLFAQLLLDPELSVSPLEGGKLRRVAKSFYKFLDLFEKGKSSFSSLDLGRAIFPLVSADKSTRQEFEILKGYIEILKDPSPEAKAITQLILEEKPVCIRGGYRGYIDRHSMIYQFIKKPEPQGDWIFLVYNTGDGLQYHNESVNPQATKHLCEQLMVYRIPADLGQSPPLPPLSNAEKEKKITAFVQELLNPRRSDSHFLGIPSENLYQVVFEKVRYLGGSSLDPQELKKNSQYPRVDWLTPQRSGTCAQKSLTQMIKAHFSQKKESKSLMYAYKLYYLETYISELKTIDSKHRALIYKAIANLARAASQVLGKMDLGTETRKDILAFLDAQKKKVEQLPSHPSPSQASQPDLPDLPPIEVEVPYFRDLNPSDRRGSHLPLRSFDDTKSLGDALKAIDDKQCNPYESLKRAFIEKFTPEDKTSPFTGSRETHLQNTLSDLHKALAILKSNTGEKMTPQSFPIVFALIVHTLRELGKSDPPPKYSPLRLWAPFLLKYIWNLKKIPHLASASPEMDHLLMVVEEVLEKQSNFGSLETQSKDFARYYAQWIPSTEKDRLLKLYEQEAHKEDFHRKMTKHLCYETRFFDPKEWCEGDDDLKVFLAYRVLDSTSAIESNPDLMKLGLQYQYEAFICGCLTMISSNLDGQQTPESPLFQMVKNDNDTCQFKFRSVGERTTVERHYIKNYLDIDILSNYPLSDSVFKKALEDNWGRDWTRSDGTEKYMNGPQSSSHQIQYQWDTSPSRDLKYSRRNIGSELENVLGYYNLHLSQLYQKEHQIFLFLSLFQPNLLFKKLTDENQGARFLQELQKFLSVSLAFFEQGQGIQTQLFLLKCSARLYNYANHPHFPPKVRQEADQQFIKLKAILNTKLKQHPQPGIPRVELLRLMPLTELNSDGKTLSLEEKFSNLIELQIQINQAHTPESLERDNLKSPAEKEEDAHFASRILQAFQQDSGGILSALLPQLLKKHYSELAPYSFAISLDSFPLCSLQFQSGCPVSYTFDLLRGELMKDDQSIRPLPFSLVSHPDYREIIGERVSATFFAHKNFYAFKHRGREYQAQDSNPPWIQVNIEGTWYTLHNRTPAASSYPFCKQSHIRWWFNQEGKGYAEDLRTHQYIYQYEDQGGQKVLISLAEGCQGTIETNTPSTQHIQKTLSAVEHPRFIEVIDLKDPSSPFKKRVRLRRYGMEFDADEKGKNLRYPFEGSTYRLLQDAKIAELAREQLAGLEVLVLEEETKSQGTHPPEIRLWIPFQPFFIPQDEKNTNIVEGLHYKLIPDHNHRLKSLHFGKDHEFNWHYDQTERMVSFTLEKGKLKAHSTEDQLYLVYLYLCQGRDDLADHALREIQLRGTAKELECIFLILKHFPSKLGKNQENPQLANPIQLAIKIRLLWMVAQLGEGSKTPIDLDPPSKFVVSDDHSVYTQDYHQALTDFYEKLPKTLAKNYAQYLDVLNNIPRSFRLNEVQEHQLLSYYMLGHDRLMGKGSNSQTLSTFLNQDHPSFNHSLMAWRWANFQLRVSRDPEEQSQLRARIDQGVRVWRGELEDQKLILDFTDYPMHFLINDTVYLMMGKSERTQVIKSLMESKQGDVKTLDDLSLSMSVDELKSYYPNFYRELLSPSDKVRQTTLLFLEAALRHCALVPRGHPEQEKIPYFYFLWVVAQSSIGQFKPIGDYYSLHDQLRKDWEKGGKNGPEPTLDAFLIDTITPLWEQEKRHTFNIPQVWVKKPVFIKLAPLNLPALSAHLSPQQRAADKKAPESKPPIAIQAFKPLQNILTIQKQMQVEVKQLQEEFEQNPSSNIYEEFAREKRVEDQVADVIFTSQELIDHEIEDFFSQHWDAFLEDIQLQKVAPSKLQQAIKKKEQTKAHLEELFSKELMELKSEEEKIEAHLQELGELTESKDLEKILALAIRVERADTQALTQIPVEKRVEFLTRVHAYLKAHFEEQWLTKMCQNPGTELPARRAWIKSLLDYNVSKTLETDILQYSKEIALYSEQQAHLDILLGLVPLEEKTEEKTKESTAKTVHMPMGGGKTALIIPTLAYTQATGERLVVVQVPAPLLNSVYLDLSRTSNQVFGQAPLKLEFDRSNDCSPITLYRLCSLFEQAIQYRRYIVTTKSTRDAFHMKLQELWLIAHEAKDKKESNLTLLNEQIRILQRINKMLNEAYAIIDEAHETYAIKEETRYTFGRELPLPSEQIQDLMHLFKSFFEFKPFKGDKSFGELLAEGALISASEEELEQQFKAFFDDKLYEEAFLEKEEKYEEKQEDEAEEKEEKKTTIKEEEKKKENDTEKKEKDHEEKEPKKNNKETRQFIFFEAKDAEQKLLSDPNTLPEFLTPPAHQRAWLYREIFQKFLAYAAHKKLFVEYGPPSSTDRRFASGLAVPYKANNVPSPNQFSNYLETAILTIFMVYAQGVNRYFFDQLIRYYKKKDREERLSSGSDKTEAETLFFSLFKVELTDVNPDNQQTINGHFEQLRRKPELILEALKNHILPKIKVHEQELVTDSVTHGALYGIRILLSGTLRSYRTFDQQVVHKPSQTLAVNGLIRKYIIRHSEVKVHPKPKSAQEHIKTLVDFKDPHLSAVIDTGAHFDGVSNLEVAQLIIQKIRGQKQETRLKWVLYYNEVGILCALSTEKPEDPPISLPGSAETELEKQLGGPEGRFTYYDQSHTTGADIRQPQRARAIMTVSRNTKESDFQQGAMRMRGLAGGDQRLTLVITPELNKKLINARSAHSESPVTPQELSDWTYQVETALLIPDHQKAVQYRMKDYLRQDLMQKMANSDSIQQGRFFTLAQSFFMKKQSVDYAQFHSVWNTQNSKVFLSHYAEALIKAWKEILIKGQKEPTPSEVQEKSRALTVMIDTALKEIEEQAVSVQSVNSVKNAFSASTHDLGAHSENQTESQTEVQQETKKELSVLDLSIQPKSVSLDFVKKIKAGGGDFKLESPYSERVNEDLKKENLTPLDLSPQLFASPEYQHIDEKKTTSCFSRYTKPIQDLLWIKKKDQLKVVILIPEEAEYLKEYWKIIKREPETNLWLSNLSGFTLEGEPPPEIEKHTQYQILREQLLFLNGNIDYLLRFKKYRWLAVDSADKIKFYKNRVSLAHLDSPIQELEERLFYSIKLYQKVQKEIIRKGYPAYKAAYNYPESLRHTPEFKQYLKAIAAVWKIFANPDSSFSSNSSAAQDLPINLQALVTEYKEHLIIQELIHDTRPLSVTRLREHLDLFYPISTSNSNPLLERFLLSEAEVISPAPAQGLLERKKAILKKLMTRHLQHATSISSDNLLKFFHHLAREGLDQDPDIVKAFTPFLESIDLSTGTPYAKFLQNLPKSFYALEYFYNFSKTYPASFRSFPLRDHFPHFFQCLKNWEKAGLNQAQVKILIEEYQYAQIHPDYSGFPPGEIGNLHQLFQEVPEGLKDLLETPITHANDKSRMIFQYLAFHLSLSSAIKDSLNQNYINPIKKEYEPLQNFFKEMKKDEKITPPIQATLFTIYSDHHWPSNPSGHITKPLLWFLENYPNHSNLWKNHLEKLLENKLQNVNSGTSFLRQLDVWLEVPSFQTFLQQSSQKTHPWVRLYLHAKIYFQTKQLEVKSQEFQAMFQGLDHVNSIQNCPDLQLNFMLAGYQAALEEKKEEFPDKVEPTALLNAFKTIAQAPYWLEKFSSDLQSRRPVNPSLKEAITALQPVIDDDIAKTSAALTPNISEALETLRKVFALASPTNDFAVKNNMSPRKATKIPVKENERKLDSQNVDEGPTFGNNPEASKSQKKPDDQNIDEKEAQGWSSPLFFILLPMLFETLEISLDYFCNFPSETFPSEGALVVSAMIGFGIWSLQQVYRYGNNGLPSIKSNLSPYLLFTLLVAGSIIADDYGAQFLKDTLLPDPLGDISSLLMGAMVGGLLWGAVQGYRHGLKGFNNYSLFFNTHLSKPTSNTVTELHTDEQPLIVL